MGDPEDPPPKKSSEQMTVYNVPVRNAYEVLTAAASRTKPRPKPASNSVYQEAASPKLRVPPVTIPPTYGPTKAESITQDLDKARSLIDEVTQDYRIRNTEKGLLVFANNADARATIIECLKVNRIFYHTHPLSSAKPKRFVLHGLTKQDINAIKDDLAEQGITPVSVNYMFTKSPRYTGQCSYILYFDKSSPITLAQLKEVRAVNRTIAKWASYKSKSSGVSPCRRCCGFGHGALNCGMPPRCIVCAGDHIVAECKFILAKHAGGHSQIHQRHLKCANCNGNHCATFKDCQIRLDYLEELEKKRKPKPLPPTKDETHYPTPVYANPQYLQYQSNVPLMSDVLQPTINQLPAPQQPPQQQGSNEDLYSMNECQSMMNELYNALQACTCRQEQAKVIADYSFKYFCKFP